MYNNIVHGEDSSCRFNAFSNVDVISGKVFGGIECIDKLSVNSAAKMFTKMKFCENTLHKFELVR